MEPTADLAGRTILVTGANTGIGRAAAEALAARGAHLILAGRSEVRHRLALEAIRGRGGSAEYLPLDLADLDSVRDAARALLARGAPLHVLVANAGLAGARGYTRQGFELTFGVNHLGHYLLTRLLLPALERGAPARVVVVASRAHERGRPWPIEEATARKRTSFTGWPEYRFSKLCNVLFAAELARRVDPRKIRSYALHPGVIASDIWRNLPALLQPLVTAFMRTPAQGAVSTLHCATSPEVEGHTGRYYDQDGSERVPHPAARDPERARRLWELSEAWVAPWLS